MDNVYIALDSDILRSLATIYNAKKWGFDASKNVILQKYSSSLIRLLNNVKADNLRLLVTTTVFNECKHLDYVRNFVNDICYVPNHDNLEDDGYLNRIRTLAYVYSGMNCGNLKTKNLKAFSVHYVAEFNRSCPCNDSYIMAEATVENCFLLTGNTKDFIGYKNQFEEAGHIARTIVDINRELGYQDEYGVTPAPFSISALDHFLSFSLKKLKNQSNIESEMKFI